MYIKRNGERAGRDRRRVVVPVTQWISIREIVSPD